MTSIVERSWHGTYLTAAYQPSLSIKAKLSRAYCLILSIISEQDFTHVSYHFAWTSSAWLPCKGGANWATLGELLQSVSFVQRVSMCIAGYMWSNLWSRAICQSARFRHCLWCCGQVFHSKYDQLMFLTIIQDRTIVAVPVYSHCFASEVLSPHSSDGVFKRCLPHRWSSHCLLAKVIQDDSEVRVLNHQI